MKARIIPLGHRDPERHNFRGDALCIRPEILRILLSIAATNRCRIGEMDISGAYSQEIGWSRLLYIRPLVEDNSFEEILLLKKPAYGLVEYRRIWYLTSDEALRKHGLTRDAREHTLYKKKTGTDVSLLVVSQVDNYVYAGTEK